ncbi:hypothetical protein PPUN109347_01420 [Pseudomonas putida]|nr:hypothetical protein PPUN109347_01420 [Pseudomonas putida]
MGSKQELAIGVAILTAGLANAPMERNRETFWYPVAIAVGFVTTVATVTALIIKLLT